MGAPPTPGHAGSRVVLTFYIPDRPGATVPLVGPPSGRPDPGRPTHPLPPLRDSVPSSPLLSCIPRAPVFWNINGEFRRYPGLPFRYRYSVMGIGPQVPGT